jgi:PAS domain S-box-containing protein
MAEAALRSESRFEALAKLAPDIISIIDEQGRLNFSSEAAERIHGYASGELVGKNTLDFSHPDDREHVSQALLELLKVPGARASMRYRYRNKDGSYALMEATARNQLQNPLIEGVITVARESGERKRVEDDLLAAHAARDEFLAIAAHELRSPITALTGYLRSIERRLRGQPAVGDPVRADLHAAMGQTTRLGNLVAELLDASRFREGQLALQPEPFEFAAFLTETLAGLAGTLEAAGCRLTLDIETIAVSGKWDRSHLAQVVENLVANAAKYAPGSPVSVRLARSERGVQLSVADRGPGISAELHARLFERFASGGASGQGGGGLGLGLYISKRIVEAHGGRLFVHSVPGHGATFVIDLPLESSAPAEVV